MSKFELLASEGAPVGFPMQVVDGQFYDKKGGALYIPNGAVLKNGWGEGRSTHIVGEEKKYLPHRFDITCFSYVENTFYAGEFELPYERLLARFNEGYYSPKLGEHTTYRKLIVGVAPGGYLTLWASGVNKNTEIFAAKLEEKEVPWERLLDNPNISRKEYIHLVYKEYLNEEEIKRIESGDVPYGLWERYARRFNWQPKVTGVPQPDIIEEIKFVNGEEDYFSVKHNSDWSGRRYAIPRQFSFRWMNSGNKKILVEFKFDAEELDGLFKKMVEKTDDMFYLNIEIRKVDKKTAYVIGLVSGDHYLPIRKVALKQYRG